MSTPVIDVDDSADYAGGDDTYLAVLGYGSDWIDNVTVVPEPGSLLLVAAGLGLVARRRRHC